MSNDPFFWGDYVDVNNIPTFEDAGSDTIGHHPGVYGSEYQRMAKLPNGDWIVVYTIYDNNGYPYDPEGGLRLQVSKSNDNGENWTIISTIKDPGRDLDNGQILVLENGAILIACRSVRWWESYHLKVFRSTDSGSTWVYLSTIDYNDGEPGSLGNPDKGVYEPHMGYLDDGSIAVFYASEKHVVEEIPYSQILSEKISTDNGASWGEEIWVAWDTQNSSARPGMPVWTKMGSGEYIVVFEDIVHDDGNAHYKISPDGKKWAEGLGERIPNHAIGPYITCLSNARLVVSSSQKQNLSYSDDNGKTWHLNDPNPWRGSFPDYYWLTCNELDVNEVLVMDSIRREEGGHMVQSRFGTIGETNYMLYEAEDGEIGNGVVIQAHPNASGGYQIAVMDNIGSFGEVTVNVPKAGTYELVQHYANGMTDERHKSLYINGIKQAQISYSVTGGWDFYGDVKTSVNLKAGANRIRIQRDEEDDIATDFDYFLISKGIKIEAESGVVGGGAVIEIAPDASGIRIWSNLNAIGSYGEITTQIDAAGTYELVIAYANNSIGEVKKSLYVNGEKMLQLAFQRTTYQDGYATLNVSISLQGGINTIRLQTDVEDDPGLTVDYFLLSAALKLEAENATIGGGAVIIPFAGASTGKFVGNMAAAGAYVEFNVNVNTGGQKLIIIRYSNDLAALDKMSLYINGTRSIDIPFKPTGSSGVFADSNVDVALMAGENTIRIQREDPATGNINIDYILVP